MDKGWISRSAPAAWVAAPALDLGINNSWLNGLIEIFSSSVLNEMSVYMPNHSFIDISDPVGRNLITMVESCVKNAHIYL